MKKKSWLDQCISLECLFPRRCIFCAAKRIDGWWCAPCAHDLPVITQRCARCGIPLSHDRVCGQCQNRAPLFDVTVAPFAYEPPIDRLIHLFKYRRQLTLTEPLTELFIAGARLDSTLPQALVPVPLHPRRLRQRGYNQALELGRSIAKRLDLMLVDDAVDRNRITASQADLPLTERHRNVRGIFSVNKPLLYPRIAIVDDVMTSGATVNELAGVLRGAGAKWIEAWVVARA